MLNGRRFTMLFAAAVIPYLLTDTALTMHDTGMGTPKPINHVNKFCSSCKQFVIYPSVPVQCHQCRRTVHFHHKCCTSDYRCIHCNQGRREKTFTCSRCKQVVPNEEKNQSSVGAVCNNCKKVFGYNEPSEALHRTTRSLTSTMPEHRHAPVVCHSCGKPFTRNEMPANCARCHEQVHNSLLCYTRGFLCLYCHAGDDAKICSRCCRPDPDGCPRRGSTGSVCEICHTKTEIERRVELLRTKQERRMSLQGR